MQVNSTPFVSVVVPCRNEEKFIQLCLDSIVGNDYPKDKREILVVDGYSEDQTKKILAQYALENPDICVIHNPNKITAAALNIGIKQAKGEYLLWMSAHNTYPKEYISKCIKAIKDYGVDNVGGRIIPQARTLSVFAKAIIKVISHPFGVGNSRFRTSCQKPVEADTVFGGCYHRDVFEKVGLFNEKLIRGQDMEFNLRLKKSGGKILLVPDIYSYYYARSSLISFFRHNFINGVWVIYPFKYTKHMPVSSRHLIPLGFVLSIIISLILTFYSPIFSYLLGGIMFVYLLLNYYFSLQISVQEKNIKFLFSLPVVFMFLHFSYGLGSLYGILSIFLHK